MANSPTYHIRVRRGLFAHLPASGELGEVFFCTDTVQLFIGAGTGQPLEGPIGSGGGVSYNVVTKTGNYTAAANDVVQCDTTAGGFTVTIPSAAANANKAIVVMKKSADGNLVTVARTGSDLLEGDTSLTFDIKGVSLMLVSNGSNAWDII